MSGITLYFVNFFIKFETIEYGRKLLYGVHVTSGRPQRATKLLSNFVKN